METEIAEAAMKGGVEHDVAGSGFDVTVEHHALMLVVDIVEPRSYIHNDAVAGSSSEDASCLFLGKQVMVKAAVRHVLVDKQELPLLVAPTWKNTLKYMVKLLINF